MLAAAVSSVVEETVPGHTQTFNVEGARPVEYRLVVRKAEIAVLKVHERNVCSVVGYQVVVPGQEVYIDSGDCDTCLGAEDS